MDELKDHYRRGGLGDVKVKRLLASIMQEELNPIRQRRHAWEGRIDEIGAILQAGCEKAQETAASTLMQVKAVMKIDYFQDGQWVAEQLAKHRQR